MWRANWLVRYAPSKPSVWLTFVVHEYLSALKKKIHVDFPILSAAGRILNNLIPESVSVIRSAMATGGNPRDDNKHQEQAPGSDTLVIYVIYWISLLI